MAMDGEGIENNRMSVVDSNVKEVKIQKTLNEADEPMITQEECRMPSDWPENGSETVKSNEASGSENIEAARKCDDSDVGNGVHPLTHLTIMIGSHKVWLKIVQAPPKQLQRLYRPLTFDEMEMEEEVDEQSRDAEQPWPCQFCTRTFSSRIRLIKHETEHTCPKPYSCSYCSKGFTHKQSLVMHERVHTGEKPFQCPICTKCFARQTNYNIHMKLHASGRRYFCSFCGKWYRTEEEMLAHQQTCLAFSCGQSVASDRPLRYQCSFCEKMFHHRRDKNIHERTHTGERPYTCGYCSKGFTQSQALTIHIRTHTGERPYTCAICAKDFRDSSALRKHEFVKHTNIRTTYSAFSSEFVSGTPLIPSSDHLSHSVIALQRQ